MVVAFALFVLKPVRLTDVVKGADAHTKVAAKKSLAHFWRGVARQSQGREPDVRLTTFMHRRPNNELNFL